MKKIILSPACSEDAKNNIEVTLKEGIKLESIKKFLSSVEYDFLNKEYPNGVVTVWGVAESRHIATFDSIDKDDIVILSTKNDDGVGAYRIKADVVFSEVNSKLGEYIWGSCLVNGHRTGETEIKIFDHIIFVKNVEDIEITYKQFNTFMGYKDAFTLQHFTILGENKEKEVERLILAFKLDNTKLTTDWMVEIKRMEENNRIQRDIIDLLLTKLKNE